MTVETADDLAAIMNIDELAVAVTYAGGTIHAMFDNETVPIGVNGSVEVHQTDPKLTCKTADVPNLAQGSTMVIGGVTYKAQAWLHDGTGVTEIELEKA
jgi:hypothetical protein